MTAASESTEINAREGETELLRKRIDGTESNEDKYLAQDEIDQHGFPCQEPCPVAEPRAEIRIFVISELEMSAPDDIFQRIDEIIVQRNDRQDTPEKEPEYDKASEDLSGSAILFERGRGILGKNGQDSFEKRYDRSLTVF